jgi:hypothetical protein
LSTLLANRFPSGKPPPLLPFSISAASPSIGHLTTSQLPCVGSREPLSCHRRFSPFDGLGHQHHSILVFLSRRPPNRPPVMQVCLEILPTSPPTANTTPPRASVSLALSLSAAIIVQCELVSQTLLGRCTMSPRTSWGARAHWGPLLSHCWKHDSSAERAPMSSKRALCADATQDVATHPGLAQLLVGRARPGHARCAARP